MKREGFLTKSERKEGRQRATQAASRQKEGREWDSCVKISIAATSRDAQPTQMRREKELIEENEMEKGGEKAETWWLESMRDICRYTHADGKMREKKREKGPGRRNKRKLMTMEEHKTSNGKGRKGRTRSKERRYKTENEDEVVWMRIPPCKDKATDWWARRTKNEEEMRNGVLSILTTKETSNKRNSLQDAKKKTSEAGQLYVLIRSSEWKCGLFHLLCQCKDDFLSSPQQHERKKQTASRNSSPRAKMSWKNPDSHSRHFRVLRKLDSTLSKLILWRETFYSSSFFISFSFHLIFLQ